MKRVALLACFLVTALAGAQSTPQPIRIKIRHADPWMVKATLEGLQVRFPEVSTLLLGGINPFAAATGTPLFPDGFFMVNANDNSLWFIPKVVRR